MTSARVVTTAVVAPLGTVAVVANSFGTVGSLCYMPAYGMQHAASTLVGQSVGARRKDLAYRFGWLTTLTGMGLLCLSGTIMYVCAPWMMGFLTQDLAVIRLGTEELRIEAFAEPLYAAIIVCSGVFQGGWQHISSHRSELRYYVGRARAAERDFGTMFWPTRGLDGDGIATGIVRSNVFATPVAQTVDAERSPIIRRKPHNPKKGVCRRKMRTIFPESIYSLVWMSCPLPPRQTI